MQQRIRLKTTAHSRTTHPLAFARYRCDEGYGDKRVARLWGVQHSSG
jgi:hypothetical protein